MTLIEYSKALRSINVQLLPKLLRQDHIRHLLSLKGISSHHDDDGHGGGGHGAIAGHNRVSLPHIARDLTASLGGGWSVDPQMKIYHLGIGGGAVSAHLDDDYDGPNGSRARHSLLVYLNSDYTGGETVFNTNIAAPHPEPGDGMIFPHSLLHEGLPVRSGVKHILKTDLFSY